GKKLDITFNLNMFKDKVLNFQRILGAYQFHITKMSDDEIYSYLAYCINGIRKNLKVPNPNHTELCHMLAVNDLVGGSNPKIGDTYFRVISMGENFPLNSYPLMISELKTLPFEFIWSSR